MKVSIVTISFNQAEFLERAIRSVLTQDYPDIEYIVVDPGSTDGSRALITAQGSRIKAILEKDNGPADGLNKGFAAATGEIFGYINADDALLPGATRQAVAAFKQHPGADIVSAHSYVVDQDARILRRGYSDHFGLKSRAHGAATLLQQSTFFRRQAFLDVGGFNTDNHTCWDGELMVDMALAGKRFHVEDCFWSIFTLHPGGISGSGRLIELYRQDEYRLFRKILGRDRRPLDALPDAVYRARRLASHPMRTLSQFYHRLAGERGRIEL
jgi:glycosyltransferase involved in cell wall biosynthesis